LGDDQPACDQGEFSKLTVCNYMLNFSKWRQVNWQVLLVNC
jgi:hypothetical protein